MSAEIVADIPQWLSTTFQFTNAIVVASSVTAWIFLRTTASLQDTVSVRNVTYPSKARVLGGFTMR